MGKKSKAHRKKIANRNNRIPMAERPKSLKSLNKNIVELEELDEKMDKFWKEEKEDEERPIIIGPGIREQNLNFYKKFTKEDIDKFIEELNVQKPKREFIAWQYCKGAGGVIAFSASSPVCDHPECLNCRAFDDALKEYSKNLSGDK